PSSWTRMQTIHVRATSTSLKTGDATIEIMHSVQSTTPIDSTFTGFATVPVSNVDVKVIDGDQPGLIVTTPPSGLQVIEGPHGTGYDSYTAQLRKGPTTGEPGTVTLSR